MDAIVLRSVSKEFRRTAVRREHTTLKTELIRFVTGRRRADGHAPVIPAVCAVDLVVPRGKTLGVIGRNGSGKSTLLKLITGIYAPTAGTIEVNGRISALLDLGAGFHPEFSGRENILINGIILGLSRAEVKARTPAIIEFSELGDFVDEPVRTYSSGMYMRLAFSVATHVDPDVLIIDEILAVGDEHFARKSRAKMDEFKRRGNTIVLVTHDLSTVQGWCDAAAWMDGGRLRLVGDPDFVVDKYRQAVADTEARDAAPTRSPNAVAVIPETPRIARRPASGPPAERGRRWGTFAVELTSVRITAPDGSERAVFAPEEGFTVEMSWVCNEPVAEACFGVGIFHSDGLHIWGSNTRIDGVPVPSPLPERGTVRLRIPRLGIGEGDYRVDVAVHSPTHVSYDYQKALRGFVVRSSGAEEGIVRPAHDWIVDLRPASNGSPPGGR